jgi:hypothetical protein
VGRLTPHRRDGAMIISKVLRSSAPRPKLAAAAAERIKYAVRFADQMAELIAADLALRLQGISATRKRTATSVRGRKQLDINFSTPERGLALGVSLKSVHIREAKGSKRYTHNMKRNEEELRIEASGYHKRQPYAVMIGVLFLPFDSCDDAKRDTPSSFGSFVRHLRPYAGRNDPRDDEDKFEKLYVALYEPDGSDLRFFDVESDPPKSGRPRVRGALLGRDRRAKRLLSYHEFLEAVHHAHSKRNSVQFRWADGVEEPVNVPGPE